jgi:16S rRNA (guanine966-N2)-methyltransferase
LIKGAIFSMLEALAYKRGFEPDEDGNFAASLAWPRVLDLYAGSGALGIEALSRGARHADFVDSDREAVHAIESNLRTTNLSSLARVHHAPVGVARVSGPFDVAFADPPYDDAGALSAIGDVLALPGLLAENAIAVVEHRANTEPPERLGPMRLTNSRRHGGTRIGVYSL